jgi:hypothetical protein
MGGLHDYGAGTKTLRDSYKADTIGESIMRIHQLPIGARFEYEGHVYVKTGPMVATSSTGQRLIPKHAVLSPLQSVDVSGEAECSETVLRSRVIESFEIFYGRCIPLVPRDLRGELEAARDCFLDALGN